MTVDLGPDTQEQQVLAVVLDDQAREDFVADTCSWCDEDIADGNPIVFLWGEPFGKMVAINVFDKQTCVEARISAYADEVAKDIILVWKSLPGAENAVL